MFKYEKALEFYEKALKIRLKKLGEDHPDVAQTYNNMANVYENQRVGSNLIKKFLRKNLVYVIFILKFTLDNLEALTKSPLLKKTGS